MMETMVEFRKS